MKKKYDVAAFVWPSYTGDEPRTRMFWQEGYGEWQTVNNAKKNGVKKPVRYSYDRRPLWGYVNEANPEIMEMEIACAAKHGVNVFIYDWYWYDNRPFLENCLNDGYLKAKNNDKVKFYLMWANHDVTHMWNVELSSYTNEVIWKGAVTMSEFKTIVERWITKYFSHPSYYKIDGKPVLMIYDVFNFVKSFGGVEGTREAVAYFRKEVKKAGYPDVHLQVVTRNGSLKIETHDGSIIDYYRDIGFDSGSEYQLIGFIKNKTDFMDYEVVMSAAKQQYEDMDAQKDVCYFPHVSLGWDNNIRYKEFTTPVIENAAPEKVEKALREAKKYVDTHDLPVPLVTINSWNEWTETSYLQPDTLYGYGYLEAVKKVFVDEEE
jgi:hypothetical protein